MVSQETNLVPRVFHLPTANGASEERPWFLVLVTNLSSWEGSQFIRVLSPLLFVTYETGSLGNHGKLSFDFATRICHIYITLLSTFETKLGLETGKR